MQHGYFPNQPPGAQQYGEQYGTQQERETPDQMTQQMGQMNLDGASAPGHHRKKKDRHAYHQLEQSTPSYGNAPNAQYLNPNGQQPPSGLSTPTGGWPQPGQAFQSQMPAGNAQASIGAPLTDTGIAMNPQAGQMGAAGQGRMNPEQIPSVPLSRDLPADYYKDHIYPTMEQHLPPPATTPFVAFDQGSASPKLARLTVNCIPSSQEQMQQTGLPLGLFLQPLAKHSEGEQPIPVLDFGDLGPPRCRRCRAYINPFMIFANGGNRMMCNLCGHPNEVGPDYFAPTDHTGVRVDRQQRPELVSGTCEFLVPKEYWSKEPVPQRYLFLIDVSAESCNRGFVQGVCDGILAALYGDDLPEENESDESKDEADPKPSKVPPRAKVGFVTYDRDIHFYNVNKSLPSPQQLVMSDLDEPFSAISAEFLFVDAAEAKTNVVSLLRSIPGMFFHIKNSDLALMSALQAALSALEASGGKVICSVGALSTYGPGKLHFRDKGQTRDEDNEVNRSLLKTEHQGFKKVQVDLVKAGIGVDFFLAAPSGGYLDNSTVGLVAEKTGGECYYYPNWIYPRDLLRLEKELCHCVQREQGYGALMKVRCSNGLQISYYYGNFTQHTFGADLELGTISEDSGMCVTFSYDGKVSHPQSTCFADRD